MVFMELRLSVNFADEGADITVGVGFAVEVGVGFVGEVRCMIHHVGAVEAVVAVDFHGAFHVDVAFVHKDFDKAWELAFDVAEVNPHDFVFGSHFGNGVVDTVTQKFGHAPLAKEHAVVVTRSDIKEGFAELFKG